MANLEKQKEKYNKAKFYDASGEKVERKAKFCPKCGPGVFMAEHNNRYTCGTCGFTEMKGAKPTEEKKETPKEEKAKEFKSSDGEDTGSSSTEEKKKEE